MTLRRFFILLLLTIFTVGVVSNTEAQFWKKKSKRHKHKDAGATSASDSTQKAQAQQPSEQKEPKKTKAQLRKEKKERKKREKEAKKELKKAKKKNKGKKISAVAAVPVVAAPPPVVIKKWEDIDYPPSKKKPHYRIDILATMYLDELVKNGYPVKNIPAKAIQGLDFYKGVQIAADTLKKANFDIDIYVHDVASADESTDMLVSKNMMDSSDLIIGAVAAKDVAPLAAYAKKKQINFISALSPSDGGVKDDQYLTILQPSLKSQCEWITGEVAGKHPAGKVLLLCRSSPQADDSGYIYLTSDQGRQLFAPVVCNSFPPKAAIAKFIAPLQATQVVIAVQDIKYADSLLRGLKQYFPYNHFEVYGMATWLSLPNLSKPGNYANLQIDIPTPFSYNEQSAPVKYVSNVFKAEYGGKPEEFVYRGYETMFWYANMLKRYGIIFNKQYSDNETAPFTKFTVKPQWDDRTGNVTYFENRHLYLRQYVDGVATERE